MRSSRTVSAVVLAAVLAALSACVTEAGARRATLQRALDEARVARSPAEIWPEVQRFVFDQGFPLVGDDRLAVGKPVQGGLSRLFSLGFQTRVRDDGSRVLESDPLASTGIRARAEARALPGGGSLLRLRFIRGTDPNPMNQTEFRDEPAELALLERVDPAAAARVAGREPPAPKPRAPGDPPPPVDAWARLRPLVGTWTGALPDGTPVRWRVDFAGSGQFVEVRGTPLLFAVPAARGGEEMGRIARTPAGDHLVWTQFTNAGRVDRYEADVGATTSTAAPTTSPPGEAEPLVFVAQAPEALPPGSRARFTLRGSGEALVATLEIAEPGKDLAPAGEVRLTRLP
jgi:hypothetical protein